MDFQKLTLKSQEAVGAAMELARRRGNPEIYPEHLCIALLDQELPRTLVERAGHPVDSIRQRCEAQLAAKPAVSGGAAQQPRASTAFAQVLDRAEE
jgi:ATP-dependent Clp protease ATP-binding subunit ClpB